MRRIAILALPAMALAAAPALGDTPGGQQAKIKLADGQQVFSKICAACHMADARGSGDGAIPALARNKNLADPAYPIGVVMKGKGAMPWFSEMLTPAEVAAVVGYVRTHFGNNYPQPVTEADVKRIARSAPRSVE